MSGTESGPAHADSARAELPCGRDAGEVWDAAGAGLLDEHVLECEFCRAIVAQRDALAAASDAYVRRTPKPPEGLTETVMQGVGAEQRLGRLLPVPTDEVAARLLVAETAIANAVRIVLDGDPAVIARRCRIEGYDPAVGVRLWLTVAVSFAHFSRHGEDAVRARVVQAVGDLFELAVARVDLDVVDVFVDRPWPASRAESSVEATP